MTTTIPTYALYGEPSELSWDNFFNLEWISERSKIHNWKIHPHVHENLIQVLFLQRGSVDVLLNYSKQTAVSPCLILIPAQTVHSLHYTSDTEGLTVTISQKALESMIHLLIPNLLPLIHEPRITPLIRNGHNDERVLQLYMAIEQELSMPALGQTAMCMSLVSALFIQILRLSDILPKANQQALFSRKAEQIDKFLKIVEQKFRMRLSIDDYANEMGMTPGHLSRLCRLALGISSLDVINMRVIQEAQRELVYTSKTIKQLAASLGFVDEAYFTRFFRKHVGVSPKKFRSLAITQIFQADESQPVESLTPHESDVKMFGHIF